MPGTDAKYLPARTLMVEKGAYALSKRPAFCRISGTNGPAPRPLTAAKNRKAARIDSGPLHKAPPRRMEPSSRCARHSCEKSAGFISMLSALLDHSSQPEARVRRMSTGEHPRGTQHAQTSTGSGVHFPLETRLD
jgi:hypothetical protein